MAETNLPEAFDDNSTGQDDNSGARTGKLTSIDLTLFSPKILKENYQIRNPGP